MFLQDSRSTSTSRNGDTSSQSTLTSHHLSHTQAAELKEHHGPFQSKISPLNPVTTHNSDGNAPQELQPGVSPTAQPRQGRFYTKSTSLLPVTHLQTPPVFPKIPPHT